VAPGPLLARRARWGGDRVHMLFPRSDELDKPQMSPTGHDDPSARVPSRDVVAIVTGGSLGTGREVAGGLARWGWAIVLVYLEDQPTAEAAVAEILAAEGRIVAVRADLGDDLDVERLFAESTAAFAGVDIVVHTTTETAAVLSQHAAQHIRARGAIVSVGAADRVPPEIARQLLARGISVDRAPPEAVRTLLDAWRRRTIG
jgi:hypothetical protein